MIWCLIMFIGMIAELWWVVQVYDELEQERKAHGKDALELFEKGQQLAQLIKILEEKGIKVEFKE